MLCRTSGGQKNRRRHRHSHDLLSLSLSLSLSQRTFLIISTCGILSSIGVPHGGEVASRHGGWFGLVYDSLPLIGYALGKYDKVSHILV